MNEPEALAPTPRHRDYADFKLAIEPNGAAYSVSVLTSPAGESAKESVAWDGSVLNLASASGGRDVKRVPRTATKEADLRRMGAALFDAFFVGQVRELFRESVVKHVDDEKGLRIKLLIDPTELTVVPWELLYDSRKKRFLALSSKTPIVRHRRLPQTVDPLGVDPPLRILGMVASPVETGLAKLDVERERALIETAVEEVATAGLATMTWLDGGTREHLHRAMWSEKWHAFHFIGHGEFSNEAGEGFLILEGSNGGADRLSADDLGVLLREQADVRLAVLNACEGAKGRTSDPFSSIASTLVQGGMGGVVAMQELISDRAAITFARVLYLAIADGLPLDAAVSSARVAVKLERLNSVEWWKPVLHMRAEDGVLFRVPARAAEAPRIEGEQYLKVNVDERLERSLRRRAWLKAATLCWLFTAIPVLAFLLLTHVPSAAVNVRLQSSGLTFQLATSEDLFENRGTLGQFTAAGFDYVILPGSARLEPAPGEPAEVSVRSGGGVNDGIFVQEWNLPDSTEVSILRSVSDAPGRYQVSVTTPEATPFVVTVAGDAELQLFGREPPEQRDFGSGSHLQVGGPSELDFEMVPGSSVELPILGVSHLRLYRDVFASSRWERRSQIHGAELRYDEIHHPGLDVAEDELLLLHGAVGQLQEGEVLADRVRVVFEGRVDSLQIGSRSVPLPSRLDWLFGHPLLLAFIVTAYVVLAVIGILSWSSNHAHASAE